uniref:Uncharacterized protein n=1 Tax=Zea mays TaxID=4577 RepID=A0A804NMU5_MAIZE
MDYTNAIHIIPPMASDARTNAAASPGEDPDIWATEKDYRQWSADQGYNDRNPSSRTGSEQPLPGKKAHGGGGSSDGGGGSSTSKSAPSQDVLQDQALLQVLGQDLPLRHQLQLRPWHGGALQAAAQLAGDCGHPRGCHHEAGRGAPDPHYDIQKCHRWRRWRRRQGIQGSPLQEVLH